MDITTQQAATEMWGFLHDPLHLAAAIDTVVYQGRPLVLVRDEDDDMPILTGYAMIAPTVTEPALDMAWSVAVFEGPTLIERRVFKERIEAIRHAVGRGFGYIH